FIAVANLQSAHGDIADRSAINLDCCPFSLGFDVELAMDGGAACDPDNAKSGTRHRNFDVSARCTVENFLRPCVDLAGLWVSALVEVHSADVCVCEHKADAMCFTC